MASGGFFAANLWWWVWEGGFGWGPRLLAPAVALSIPWLAGRGRAWRRAAFGLALFGFVLNLPAYLFAERRLYSFVELGPSPGAPVSPGMPRHRAPDHPGDVHPAQRLHYIPAAVSWIEGPGFFSRSSAGQRKRNRGRRGRCEIGFPRVRLLLGKPALPAISGVGRLLFDDAEMAADVEPQRALTFARAAIDLVRRWTPEPLFRCCFSDVDEPWRPRASAVKLSRWIPAVPTSARTSRSRREWIVLPRGDT